MSKQLRRPLTLTFLIVCSLFAWVWDAAAQGKTPDYKITRVKIVPFDEQAGKFDDEITATTERAFFNDLSTSLFVTFEISGEPGTFADGRKISVTVTEGKRIKFSKTEQVGLIGEGGKYYFPVYLYSAMCDEVKITAKLLGQKTPSTVTRKIPFMCGE